MGNYTKQLSSWRKHLIDIRPHECKTYNFFDTKPNMIFVQNPSDKPLLVSLDNMPTLENYDWRIKGNFGRCIGRPYGTQQIYLINTSDNEITVPMWSINDEFQFSILQDFTIENLTIDEEALKNLTYDGIIKGFESALPSGNNTIGKVDLTGNANQLLSSIGTTNSQLVAQLNNIYLRQNEIIQKINNLRPIRTESMYGYCILKTNVSGDFSNLGKIRIVEITNTSQNTEIVVNSSNSSYNGYLLDVGESLKNVFMPNGFLITVEGAYSSIEDVTVTMVLEFYE